jgi:hypothetical protein
MKKTIKKAQTGKGVAKYTPSWEKPTADSTDYYKEKAKDMAKAYGNTGNMKFGKEAGDAIKSMHRQKMKGKPGFTGQGFPIKQKVGGKTTKAKTGTSVKKSAKKK